MKIEEIKDLDDPEDLAEGGRPGFAGGSKDSILSPQMQDYINNYSDQMTFEEYLQMTVKRKKSAGGGLNYLMGSNMASELLKNRALIQKFKRARNS